MNTMAQDIITLIMFWLSFIILILMFDIKFKWKFLGGLICWMGLGISIALLYPDEFSDFVLGDPNG